VIRVGPAGWSYRDWDGIVYPSPKPRGFQPLAVVARLFDAAEVNVTFYHPPQPEIAENWCRLLDKIGAESFRFSVKLWQGLTHGDETSDHAEAQRLRALCELLRERGRLIAMLAQFPWSFRCSPASFGRLERLADEWREFDLAVEVRHGSWDGDEYLAWLRERGLAFVNIDQPVIGESLGPTAHVTTPALAYVRLHGQNREAWFAEDQGRDERYNYLYSSEELAPWAVRIGQMSSEAAQTLVITNNHYRGQAIMNGLELQAATAPERVVAVPRRLIEHSPTLRGVPGLHLAEEDFFTVSGESDAAAEGQLNLF
jgi:uncharacterized protein YecE (DUF72 family)